MTAAQHRAAAGAWHACHAAAIAPVIFPSTLLTHSPLQLASKQMCRC